MKRNDIPIILSTAAYSFLFYNQTEGVNYFLFNILLIFFLTVRDRELIYSRAFMAAAAGALVSSFCIFWYGTDLPYMANIISLILLAGVSTDRNSSFLIACLHSLYSFVGTMIFMLIDILNNINSSSENSNRHGFFNKVILGIIPFVIFLIFFFIYRSANPIFDKLASGINFDFISVGWCFFTIGGFILMYGFFKQRVVAAIQKADHDTPDELIPVSSEQYLLTTMGKALSVSNLVYTGVLLLLLLNVLLATVNATDIYYLMIKHGTPTGITFSEYLHNGTNSLIASIILAVSVILFYFKGYLNFYEGNAWLKRLAYVWIGQNIVLVISTAYRNTVYIGDFGLTHKRIGVYVYLLLCVVGLITTFIKIARGKNNWFLFRKNAWIFYGLMILSCPFDWDSIITNFDINTFESTKTLELDQYYLAGLGHANFAVMFDYYIVQGKTLRLTAFKQVRSAEGAAEKISDKYTEEVKNMLWYKYLEMERDYAGHHWQSHCVSKSNNLHAVEKMIKDHGLICPVSLR